jgi:hypothetical protein
VPQSNDLSNDAVLLLAMDLAGGVHGSVTDIAIAAAIHFTRQDARSRMSVPALGALLRSTIVTATKCEFCGAQVRVAISGGAFCAKCARWLDESRVPRVIYSFQTDALLGYVTQSLISRTSALGLSLSVSEPPYTRLVQANGAAVDILVRPGEIGFEDYYELRGWRPSVYGLKAIVGSTVDPRLLAYSAREPDCLVRPIADVLAGEDGGFSSREVQSRLESLSAACQGAKEAGIEPRQDKFASESRSVVSRIIESLPKWACQASVESAREQETSFEKGVLTLLNLTAFRAKHLGGRDQPDGFIQLTDPLHKLTWVPVETKTARLSEEESYSVAGCRVQLEKYGRAFTSPNVTRFVHVPAFMVVAKDFDLFSSEERSIVDSLEADLHIKFQFMPVETLLYLLERWAGSNLIHVDPRVLIDFLSGVRYVSAEDVDRLIERLNRSSAMDASILREVRREVHSRKGS